MKWIKEHKEILLQIVVFTGIGLYFHKTWMLYFVAGLAVMLPSKIFSSYYILYLNKTINYIGFLIKTILFTLLFAFVIIPISLILRMNKNENPVDFIDSNSKKDQSSFLKMW